MKGFKDHSTEVKTLSLLVTVLIAGVMLFAAISIGLYFLGNTPGDWKKYNGTVFAIDLVVSAVVLIILRAVYAKRLQALKDKYQTATEKLEQFRALTITHMAVCEFTALAGIIGFMMLGNFLFFLVVAMALVEMLNKFPTAEKMESVVNSASV